MPPTLTQDVPSATELLVLPEFAAYDETTDSEIIVRLETWKQRACDVLCSLRKHLEAHKSSLGTSDQAEVVFHVVPLASEEVWVLEDARIVAQDILSTYITPHHDVLEKVLRDYVKPTFQSNPHPQLNVETGRKLSRPAGGSMGHLDYLEGQQWKTSPSMPTILSWCILHSDSHSVERLWHLYIPPVMTLLDDHEAMYKLRGVRLVSQLLEVIPSSLLRRTGVDTLLLESLRKALNFLHNPETPDLLRVVVPTTIQLIRLTTAEGSSARFDQLCALLGDGIIGNVWIYASRDPDTLQASIDVLPDLVRALDIGSVRYLKALVPQLVFPLIPAAENGASFGYQMSSLEALSTVIRVCSGRIHKWKCTILEGILKCWVDISLKGTSDEDCVALKCQLKQVSALLADVCKDASISLEAERSRILSLDSALFAPLLCTRELSSDRDVSQPVTVLSSGA